MHHLRYGRWLSEGELSICSRASSSSEWLPSMARQCYGDTSFIVFPLFPKMPPPENANILQLIEYSSIKSDWGLTLTEWSRMICITIPSYLVVLDTTRIIRSFLEHIGVAGVIIEGAKRDELEALGQWIEASKVSIFIHITDITMARESFDLGTAALCMSLEDIAREPEEWLLYDPRLIFINTEIAPDQCDLVKRLMTFNVGFILADGQLGTILNTLFNTLPCSIIHSVAHEHEDVLQIPLQPLSDNLSSSIYHTFERDKIKYVQYEAAITEAFKSSERREWRVMVVGAGRGPLIDCIFKSARQNYIQLQEVMAIEKNPFAYLTLLDRNKVDWNDQVRLFLGDIRELRLDRSVDLIVSELLGSFGDNELSPECIVHARKYLDANGLMIPTSSESFLMPVSYPLGLRNIHLHPSGFPSALNSPHVVYTRRALPLSSCHHVFSFDYYADYVPKTLTTMIDFETNHDGYLDGFMGYFRSTLFGSVSLSTHPLDHTLNMASWFPIFFPCPIQAPLVTGSHVKLTISRCSTEQAVWYQWSLDKLQYNDNGEHYKIKL